MAKVFMFYSRLRSEEKMIIEAAKGKTNPFRSDDRFQHGLAQRHLPKERRSPVPLYWTQTKILHWR
ncbi:MAG: hypothetical protein RQM89_04725 [Acetomicrobium sp.]